MSNSKLDLTISQVIKAPRLVVWSAWENPDMGFVNGWGTTLAPLAKIAEASL